jgi:hypothetical protein
MDADAISCWFTTTMDLPTGWAFTKVVWETAVTPPLTFLFKY